MNPLFTEESPEPSDANSYLLARSPKRLEPTGKNKAADNPAVEMIRRKLDALYAQEPNARKEAAEVTVVHPRSKHQEFMYKLTTSGSPMAEIQAAWHRYYANLPDNEKHEVWQEFYAANAQRRMGGQQLASGLPGQAWEPAPAAAQASDETPKPIVVHHEQPEPPSAKPDRKAAATLRRKIRRQVKSRATPHRRVHATAKQHLHSLAFGIGIGTLVLIITLFGLFNEMIIAPFIRPGSASATPIILSADSVAPSDKPEIIIPKLNAELPVIYGLDSLNENTIQNALEDGVIHYPTTALPGQNGNAAFFGHSSNNIFNPGHYKFAFVLLHEMEPGDLFYLTYNKKVYTYKVFDKKIINPDETWVLNPVAGKTATATLITCDPPGTTLHRLVVWGEQISPNPATNSGEVTPAPALQSKALPDNGPSMWSQIWQFINPFD